MTLTLETKPREAGKDLDTLRKDGFIPAVYYGKKQEATPVALSQKDFLKVFEEAGESTVVTLKGEKDLDALIHDVSYHPVSGDVRHVDFYVFEEGQTVSIQVPLEFVGESEAVKQGAVLNKVLHEVEVEASPRDLPSSIEIDISVLVDINSQISVGSITLAEGVTMVTPVEEVIAVVNEAKEEVEEVPVEVEGEEGAAEEGDAAGEGEETTEEAGE
jgi:large subunit ribosomal protein L25